MRTTNEIRADMDAVANAQPFDNQRYHQLANEFTASYLGDKRAAQLAYYRGLTTGQLQAELDRAKRTTFEIECSDSYGMRSVIDESRRIESVIASVIKEKME